MEDEQRRRSLLKRLAKCPAARGVIVAQPGQTQEHCDQREHGLDVAKPHERIHAAKAECGS